MNINAISNAQYRYHSPLPFSGKKAEKFSMEKDYPDVHAFYQAHKTFDPKIGSISCAPDEVQNFYGEITPELNKFKAFYSNMQKEEKSVLTNISNNLTYMQNLATKGALKDNAKMEVTDTGYTYKEYNGKFITKEITRSPKKLKIEKAEGNNRKTITSCDLEVDKQTGKTKITKVRHLVNYHKTGLGGESYDKEYIFEGGKLKRYTQNYSTDGKGNGKADIVATFGEKVNSYFENMKIVNKEGSFLDKAIMYDKNGQVGCYMKYPIKDEQGIGTFEKKMEFENGQPSLYIREGIIKSGNSEDTYERYAKFTGTSWCFLY